MNIFSILMALAMFSVVASLLIGLVFMVKGGGKARKNSNKMMKLRVALQGLALLFFVLAMLTQGK
ncbi:MAG: twin transmembrane helix small protein [Alphaproteobacteria bacterium CG_4_9_14_3_um_filter_47_13]|nr:MAG: twin transmembrane helix small protein [Alphaproteobacteria bacterium CG_4_9_14_3_um_filter_47_13]